MDIRFSLLVDPTTDHRFERIGSGRHQYKFILKDGAWRVLEDSGIEYSVDDFLKKLDDAGQAISMSQKIIDPSGMTIEASLYIQSDPIKTMLKYRALNRSLLRSLIKSEPTDFPFKQGTVWASRNGNRQFVQVGSTGDKIQIIEFLDFTQESDTKTNAFLLYGTDMNDSGSRALGFTIIEATPSELHTDYRVVVPAYERKQYLETFEERVHSLSKVEPKSFFRKTRVTFHSDYGKTKAREYYAYAPLRWKMLPYKTLVFRIEPEDNRNGDFHEIKVLIDPNFDAPLEQLSSTLSRLPYDHLKLLKEIRIPNFSRGDALADCGNSVMRLFPKFFSVKNISKIRLKDVAHELGHQVAQSLLENDSSRSDFVLSLARVGIVPRKYSMSPHLTSGRFQIASEAFADWYADYVLSNAGTLDRTHGFYGTSSINLELRINVREVFLFFDRLFGIDSRDADILREILRASGPKQGSVVQ